jgi:hypothetical protein
VGHHLGESLTEIPEERLGDLVPPGGGHRGRRSVQYPGYIYCILVSVKYPVYLIFLSV